MWAGDGLPPQAHLVQAAPGPRAWHMRLKEELVAFMAHAALFTRIVAGEQVYLVVLVNDILVAARGAERIAKVKAHLAEKFDMRDRGAATYSLGMELTCDRKARMHPEADVEEADGRAIGRYGQAEARAGGQVNEGGPDIAQSVGALAHYMAGPTKAHWRAALEVVRSLAEMAEDVRSKHNDVIHQFARERMARKEVAFAYCKTEDMKADNMIEALAPGKFEECKSEISIA
ncbi:hypothetical protein KFL_015490010 [Klebsormidium nitens]|uniref:Reverse transcriptase Ty1/copia-type domain-containing protein n=1 Tax=Klebsormidium nitens TaxID=105231 RepID=A0A1Y1IVN5_KLENI|nr:hypothetical protein KFL_015490010 [Klebsormidium nitens]|eukprot:GAQ93461.1 hypothetical protein KFL_015490010 [Klebsormidium nitens]